MLPPLAWIVVLAILPWSCLGKSPEQCGIMGDPVEIGQVAWHASVEVSGKAKCGGAILKAKYILTAASCVNKIRTNQIKVRMGTAVRKEGGTLSGVCKVVIHGQFNPKALDSNLALLQLCEPAAISDTIKEIAVIDKQPDENASVLASGWGSTNWWGSFSSSCWAAASVVLRKATLSIHDLQACRAERKGWGLTKGITDLNICTTKSEKLCSFDLGSPLVSNDQLVGILSKGDCYDKAEVYSSLVNHKGWLDLNTKD